MDWILILVFPALFTGVWAICGIILGVGFMSLGIETVPRANILFLSGVVCAFHYICSIACLKYSIRSSIGDVDK